MRMALGTTDGESVDVEKAMRVASSKRPRRITNPEMLRVRRAFMARMRDAGTPLREIGEFFRCTRQNVQDQLRHLEGDRDGDQRRAG